MHFSVRGCLHDGFGGAAIAGNVIEAAGICESLDLGPVDAIELGWHTEKGRHLVQAWPRGGAETPARANPFCAPAEIRSGSRNCSSI
jgi:hypothetical protein